MSESKRFLDALMGDGLPSPHAAVVFTLPGWEATRYSRPTLARPYIEKTGERRNVYIGVGMRDAQLEPGKRGKASDVSGIFGMWADIDIAGPAHDGGKAYPPNLDAALKVAHADLEPSVVVDSGHGLHIWWLFPEPWIFEDGDRDEAVQLAKDWSRLLKARAKARGWEIDSTHDLARVLRVPGTMNLKAENAPVPVKLLLAAGPRYSVDDFQDVLEECDINLTPDPKPNKPALPVDLADQDLLNKLFNAKNGERVRRLWEGDSSDYPSHSEADAALCMDLAFWTGRDAQRMDSTFRRSGLMREKWEREDYRQATIESAIEKTVEVFEPKAKERQAATQFGSNGPDRSVKTERTVEVAGPDDQAPDWDDPLPLDHCGRLPVFPVNVLPPDFVTFVMEIAESRQVPVDMPAVAVLAALAAAAAGRYQVELPSHTEPCNLYTVCALPPGLRKTQTLHDVTVPLHESESRLVESMQFQVDRDRAAREVAEARAKQLQSKAAKTEDPAERQMLQAELAELHAETGEPVTLPRLTFDDATPERVAQLLAENSGRLAMFSAEGGIVGMMAGRYSEKGGPNLDVYLKAHAGDPLRVDRASGRTVNLRAPALTLCLLVQPEVLRELAQVKGGRGRGLLGRFLYSLPEPNLGTRMYQPRGIDPAAEARYQEKMLRLFSAQPDGEVRGLKLQGQALKVWASFHDRIERRLTPDGDLRPIADWAAKVAGAAARMAGIFHVAKYPDPETVPIEPETVAAAVTIADYFVAHAGAAFGEMADSPTMALARRVMAWIERHDYPDDFTVRDLHQHNRDERPQDLLLALRLLAERGIVYEVRVEASGPGRNPSPRFLANPNLRKTSHKSPNDPEEAPPPHSVISVTDSQHSENEIREAVEL